MNTKTNGDVPKQASATKQTASKKTVARWYTEGCIKEVKLEGNEVTLKIEPTEAFAFGVDDVKKILFDIGEKPSWKGTNPVDAKLVEAETEFCVCKNTRISFALLCQMKKDNTCVRMGVNKIGTSKPRIQSVVLI